MPKNFLIYLEDIIEAINRIEKYVNNLSYISFSENNLVIDAVIRNLEIIGEASKNIPSEIKEKYPNIEWKKIIGLRDILIHAYSGVNLEILWDIIINKIPKLKILIKRIIKDLS
jgi:uncharacterized protein with HEPN domain